MAEEAAVQVCLRVRPLVEREKTLFSGSSESVQLYWQADKNTVYQVDDRSSNKSFSFDRVFTSEESTHDLYQSIAKPLVVSTVKGYNGTIFAYGQTSSGKTFTMMGSKQNPGVIPLAIEDVFQTIKKFPNKEFLLRVSYMEIYNETVSDLLVDKRKRKPLEVREMINKNIFVADLTEEVVRSCGEALQWIQKGEENRHYERTKMNERSSRSHTIFRMILESREMSDQESSDGAIIVSHLNLVDLAGSERASQTGAEGARFKEGCNINRSLFTLGQVIKKLTDESQKSFVNYRDSKLTRILQNSLGGNAKTVIICTITPATLDETLSTLQFASTAKKMKNDPHVTEVLDDGALLRRYRNEITDLKQRLQEVSTETQTTVTEKEVLSQLLQEKEQLQREQQEKIINLTRLIVTSSNLVHVPQRPKRRVTWGGKMIGLVPPLRMRTKGDYSCLMVPSEVDEDFDSHWGIPDEPPDEMETSQSSVIVRSFGESPRVQDQVCELSEKVSKLELQLEMESRKKDEAIKEAETLNGRVAELQSHLQIQAGQNQEANENIQSTEQKVVELERELQHELQQKRQATEMLELRIADLQRRLEEQSNDDSVKMNKEFAETIQLCESLASEKDMIAAERDYLQQELGTFLEQVASLEKEKAVLAKELKERRDLDEFTSLEEDLRKENEKDLQTEIYNLKNTIKASEHQCFELQEKVKSLSEELKRKNELAEELEDMNGRDLVKEVAKLRRSLDDAEGVSRDTKKEWAILRTESIALKEQNMILTAKQEKMEAELTRLNMQLETEKSRYKQMQSDLQKELNVAFSENSKLTTLLDGKVPQNLIEHMDLERSVSSLNKELSACRKAEEALRAQLEELSSFQHLPEQVDALTQQVSELTEELRVVQNERNDLVSGQVKKEQDAQELRDTVQSLKDELLKVQADLQTSAQREESLNQQYADLTQQMDSLQSDLEQAETEKNRLIASIEDKHLKATATDAHLNTLEDELKEQPSNSELVMTYKQKESELQEHILRLSQELQCMQEQNLAPQSANTSSEELERLHMALDTLTAERDQLKVDLADSVDMMIENQEELRGALEKNREQMKRIKRLESEREQELDCTSSPLLELQGRLKVLTEEREHLLSENEANSQTFTEEMDKLQCRVTSLIEERNQLQAILEGLREEKKELHSQLEETTAMLAQEQSRSNQLETPIPNFPADNKNPTLLQQEVLTEELERARAERERLFSENEANSQTFTEEMDKLQCRVTSLTEERNLLQEILEGLREEKKELHSQLEETTAMLAQEQSRSNQLETPRPDLLADNEKLIQLEQELKVLTEELERARAERERLFSENEANSQTFTEEMDKLQCRVTSLTEERNRLQEILEGLREEKKELHSQLEEHTAMLKVLTEELERARAERERLFSENEANSQTFTEEMDKLQCRVTSLIEERNQLQEILEGLREEKKELHSQLEETTAMLAQEQSRSNQLETPRPDLPADNEKLIQLEQELKVMTEELERARAERERLFSENEANSQTFTEEMDKLQCRVTSLTEERNLLQEILEGLREEKKELHSQLEETTAMLAQEQSRSNQLETPRPDLLADNENLIQLEQELKVLTEELERARAERERLFSENEANSQTFTEEMDKLQCRVTSLTEERNQLQEILEGLREEKKELHSQLEETTAMVKTLTEELAQFRAEQERLLFEKDANIRSSSEMVEKLLCRVTTLSEERGQLHEVVDRLREDKKELQSQLEERMAMIQQVERRLDFTEMELSRVKSAVQEKEVNNENREEARTSQEMSSVLQQENAALKSRMAHLKLDTETLMSQNQMLTEELDKLRGDSLVSETIKAEKDELLCAVTSLTGERDQLKEEKEMLRSQLEDTAAMVSSLEKNLNQQEQLYIQKQTEKEEQQKELLQQVQHLKEQIQMERRAPENSSKQLLNEANTSFSVLKHQVKTFEKSSQVINETSWSQLQRSTDGLKEVFGNFQRFIQTCKECGCGSANRILIVPFFLEKIDMTSLPKPTWEAYSSVCQLGMNISQNLSKSELVLHDASLSYMKKLEEIVSKDVSLFVEKQLQDLLLFRRDAKPYSVGVKDFSSMWDQSLFELLEKRQLYLEKFKSILGTIWANLTRYRTERDREISERQMFKEHIERLEGCSPVSFSELTAVLNREMKRRSAAAQSTKLFLQTIVDEHNNRYEEMRQIEGRGWFQLKEEKKKNSTLLTAMERADLVTEVSLLKENQQLTVQLKETKGNLQALHVQLRELASERLSDLKQATRPLETELKEKENTIQTLKSKLQEAEKKTLTSSAAEMETLQNKLFKMETQLASESEEHQQEIQRMKTVLSLKEESLRKLKETLRRQQQQADDSILQGEELHARLIKPRGTLIQSSTLLEKVKLEEEVQQLRLRVTELESLVCSQQADISKWKNRAIKVKDKIKAEVDKVPSPGTSRKRILSTPSKLDFLPDSPKKALVDQKKVRDSPRKALDSPKAFLLSSPKSRFFDVAGSSDALSKNRPKQFFDNSELGTLPDVSGQKTALWPSSPTKEDMCKAQ